MKAQADKHITEFSFQVGDSVLVKLQPYRQQSLAHRTSFKLGKKYFGPFPISKSWSGSLQVTAPRNLKNTPSFPYSMEIVPYSLTTSQTLPLMTNLCYDP